MILGDPEASQAPQDRSNVAIDEIFRLIARRRPDALAIADAPNRQSFTDGAPRRLSYAQAEQIVEAIAQRLRQAGLPTDAIVGIQLPNTVEHVLALLGVLRAGMIAAPLPLLWRRADTVAALARIGCKALFTCGHVGAFNHCQFALRVAAEVFSIRYVCGFGADLPDGVVSFEDLLGADRREAAPPFERDARSNSAARIAVITFDVGEGGVVPVARTHLELLAGGIEVLLESRLAPEGVVLSTLTASSFAGICLTLLPWMLSGATLLLHHPFNSHILGRQWRDDRFSTLILPAAVAFRLAGSGAFARQGPARIIAAWRSPELLATSPVWSAPNVDFIDVAVFGETALVAVPRGGDGRPAALQDGPLAAPRASEGGVVVAELAQTEANTLAFRGPMVPHHAFPPGIERSGLPHFMIGRGGLVDTGYTCRVDPATRAVEIGDPASGMVSVGGYRFPLRDLQDVVGRIDAAATLTALSDPLVGQRLVGTAADRAAVRAALNAVGVNPIVVNAFGGDTGAVPAAAGAS